MCSNLCDATPYFHKAQERKRKQPRTGFDRVLIYLKILEEKNSET